MAGLAAVLVRRVVDAGVEVQKRAGGRVGGASVMRVGPPYRSVVETRVRVGHGREERRAGLAPDQACAGKLRFYVGFVGLDGGLVLQTIIISRQLQ